MRQEALEFYLEDELVDQLVRLDHLFLDLLDGEYSA